jgi:hypothetical protein
MDVDSNGPEASTSGSGSSSGSQVHPNSGNGNGNVKSTFLPLVSIAITEQAEDERGPLQTALNTLFLSALHRTQNRNGICTVFLHNILALWTLVIATWTTPMPPKDEKDAVASWDPYTIPPVRTQHFQRGTVAIDSMKFFVLDQRVDEQFLTIPAGSGILARTHP